MFERKCCIYAVTQATAAISSTSSATTKSFVIKQEPSSSTTKVKVNASETTKQVGQGQHASDH